MDVTQTPANSVQDETAGTKRKRGSKNIFNIAYGQAANNITDETDAPELPVLPKRNRTGESFATALGNYILAMMSQHSNNSVNPLHGAVRRLVREEIFKLGGLGMMSQRSNSVDPLPGAVRRLVREEIFKLGGSPDGSDPDVFTKAACKLSDPSTLTSLPFPFVGESIPKRFKTALRPDRTWLYAGREKFARLVSDVQEVRQSTKDRNLWVYGTKGYGKSHLLAALVCYLSAKKDEKVIYIPDCRLLAECPLPYICAALTFAWEGDYDTQQQIANLTTLDAVVMFLTKQSSIEKNVIFVIDQLNGLLGLDGSMTPHSEDISRWLEQCRSEFKAVLSSSANYKEFFLENEKQNNNKVLFTYGGLSPVSFNSTKNTLSRELF
jgi:hypothetical protein